MSHERRIWGFDANGTLCPAIDKMTGPELLPGVKEQIDLIVPKRSPCAIMSNQGGSGALRSWLLKKGHDVSNLWSPQQSREVYVEIARRAFGDREHQIYLSFAYQTKEDYWLPTPKRYENREEWAHDWRKPGPGMIEKAMTYFRMQRVTFVGDRETDYLAAQQAGPHVEYLNIELFMMGYARTPFTFKTMLKEVVSDYQAKGFTYLNAWDEAIKGMRLEMGHQNFMRQVSLMGGIDQIIEDIVER